METNFGMMSVLFWHEIESEMSDFFASAVPCPEGICCSTKSCKIDFYSKLRSISPIFLFNSLTKLKKLEKHQS